MKQEGALPWSALEITDRPRDGEAPAFAIIADPFEGPGGAAADAIDRIAVRLAAFSRIAN